MEEHDVAPPGEAALEAWRPSPFLVDALLALLVTALALFSLVSRVSQVLLTEEGESLRFRPPDALAVVVLVIGTLALAWRRRAPLLVLVISAGAFFIDQWLGYAPPPLPFAPLIALYTVATMSATVVAACASAAVAAGVVVIALTYDGPFTDDQVLAYLISVAAAWMLGYGVQLDRARAALLEDRTRQLAREQAAATELAVQREKARIARELHDVVAHNVSVIVAQAAAAQRVFDRARDESRQALVSIEAAGRDALTEMRRLLGVLDTTSPSADRAPQPGLDQLAALVASIERAGLPVELVVEGEPRPVPAGVALNAYRIVQEALTNTLKHAQASRARVVLTYAPDAIELHVSDNGGGGPINPAPGRGLVGMRQRAALLGGELSAGPGADGGFVVTAKLPARREGHHADGTREVR